MAPTVLANITLLAPWSYVDDLCRWAILVIGAITALSLRRRFGMAVVPLGGLLVLLADSHLYWARYLVQCALFKIGYLQNLAGTLGWYVTWQVIPVILTAVMAGAFVAEVRKRDLHGNGP